MAARPYDRLAMTAPKRVSYTLPSLMSFDDDSKHRFPYKSTEMQVRSLPVFDLPATKAQRVPSSGMALASPVVSLSATDQPSMREKPPKETRPRHMRPINALAMDTTHVDAYLYSAGIDGLVCMWDLGHVYPGGTYGAPRYMKNMRLHRSWIWDLKLCNRNETVLTCSSDCTIKAWNVGASSATHELGTHNDFVKALAPAHDAGYVASCSLDHTVSLWDIREGRTTPVWRAHTPSSLYSIASNRAGSVIVSGGVDHVVRGWDPRMRDPTFELMGHEDNVRAMTMSDDGRFLLSGSSDTTICLWSLGEQRRIHTLTHHNASIWSLYSDDPQLSTFYSGDRQGYLCKVEWDRSTPLEQAEGIVLAHEKEKTTGRSHGIVSIAAYTDEFVWTSNTGSASFSRWADVPRRANRASAQATGRFHGNTAASTVNLRPPDMLQFLSSDETPNLPSSSTGPGASDTSDFHSRLFADEATPMSSLPQCKVKGFHGMVRAVMLNDRVHTLTVDTGGIVALWNIVLGQCLGTFDPDAVYAAAQAQEYAQTWTPRDSPSDTLDIVRGLIEGNGATPPWCTLDTSSGALTVYIDEDKVWAAEVYTSELLPMESAQRDALWKEDRVFLSVFVLRQLFRRFLATEKAIRQAGSDGQPLILRWLTTLNLTPEALLQVPLSQLPNSTMPAGSDASLQSILANMTCADTVHDVHLSNTSEHTEAPLVTSTLQLLHALHQEETGKTGGTSPSSNTVETGTSILGFRRRSSSRRSRKASSMTGGRPDVVKLTRGSLEDQVSALVPILQTTLRDLPAEEALYTDDMAVEMLHVMPSSGENKIALRGKIGTMGRDTPLLELLSPLWLLRLVLSPVDPDHESPRIKVLLQKVSDANESRGIRLPVLTQKVSEISTTRLLRIGRLSEYIYKAVVDMGVQLPTLLNSTLPEDIPIDILCHGSVVPPIYTLAQCQTYCWKNSAGSMTLQYRWRESK